MRRLAAIDMYGRHASKRRRRLILAEFVFAAIGIPLLGLVIALAATSTPLVLLGAYLTGIGLNYVPLACHAISLSPTGRQNPGRFPSPAAVVVIIEMARL